MACTNCPYTVKSTAIDASGGDVTITIPAIVLRNRQPLNVIIAQSIPNEVTPDMSIIIESPDFKLTVITPWGNFMHGDQLLSRRVLRTRVATDTLGAVVTNLGCFRGTSFTFETLPPATPPKAKGGESK